MDGIFVKGDHVGDITFRFFVVDEGENLRFQVSLDYDVDAHNGASCNIRLSKNWLLNFEGQNPSPEKLFQVVDHTHKEFINITQAIVISQKIAAFPPPPELDKDAIIRQLASPR